MRIEIGASREYMVTPILVLGALQGQGRLSQFSVKILSGRRFGGELRTGIRSGNHQGGHFYEKPAFDDARKA